MKNNKDMKKLTVTNLIKTKEINTGRIVRVTEGSSYVYYGKNKSECINQAKRDGRLNATWKKVWSEEENSQ